MATCFWAVTLESFTLPPRRSWGTQVTNYNIFAIQNQLIGEVIKSGNRIYIWCGIIDIKRQKIIEVYSYFMLKREISARVRCKSYSKEFHPTHYNGCNYSSMLGFKLNHARKRGPMCLSQHYDCFNIHEWTKRPHFAERIFTCCVDEKCCMCFASNLFMCILHDLFYHKSYFSTQKLQGSCLHTWLNFNPSMDK